jgi:hypothetical protein
MPIRGIHEAPMLQVAIPDAGETWLSTNTSRSLKRRDLDVFVTRFNGANRHERSKGFAAVSSKTISVAIQG